MCENGVKLMLSLSSLQNTIPFYYLKRAIHRELIEIEKLGTFLYFFFFCFCWYFVFLQSSLWDLPLSHFPLSDKRYQLLLF